MDKSESRPVILSKLDGFARYYLAVSVSSSQSSDDKIRASRRMRRTAKAISELFQDSDRATQMAFLLYELRRTCTPHVHYRGGFSRPLSLDDNIKRINEWLPEVDNDMLSHLLTLSIFVKKINT